MLHVGSSVQSKNILAVSYMYMYSERPAGLKRPTLQHRLTYRTRVLNPRLLMFDMIILVQPVQCNYIIACCVGAIHTANAVLYGSQVSRLRIHRQTDQRRTYYRRVVNFGVFRFFFPVFRVLILADLHQIHQISTKNLSPNITKSLQMESLKMLQRKFGWFGV